MDFVRSLFNDLFKFIIERPDIILNAVIEHVYITVVSLFIAAAIGIALGVLITRVRFLYDPILAVASTIYTIPSIAMFVIMIRVGREIADQNVPILKDIFGIGFGSAVIALVLYLLLMIIRNTAVGIDSVDPEIIEAARGMGMTSMGILFRIELPLALPIIFAGLRIAAVSAISLATIAAFIGAGGIGDLIFQGLESFSSQRSKVVAGALATSVMAISTEVIFRKIEQGVSPGLSGGFKTLGESIADSVKYLRDHPDTLVIFGVAILLLAYVGFSWVEPFASDPALDDLLRDPGIQRILRESDFTLEKTGYDLAHVDTDAPIKRSLGLLPWLAIAAVLVASLNTLRSPGSPASADVMLVCSILMLFPLLHFYYETQSAVGELGAFSELFRKMRNDTIDELRTITSQRIRIGVSIEVMELQIGYTLAFIGTILTICGAFLKALWFRRQDQKQEEQPA